MRKDGPDFGPLSLTGLHKLSGKGATVEFDEAYAGGKKRRVGSGYVGNKTMILGALQRGEIAALKTRKQSTTAFNHSAEEWVRGDVHTNGIEGVWSLFKRVVLSPILRQNS